MQIADDPASQIPKVWLGPTNSWRWPWDWTYQEWALAVVSFAVGGTLLTWVLPAGAVAAGAALLAARHASRTLAPESPRRWFWTVLGTATLLLAMISPNPSTWIGPIWLPLALLLSPGIPWWTVRTFGRYVDWNRPIAWWIKVPGQVARGPREIAPAELDASGLALNVGKPLDPTPDLTPHPVHRITTAPKTGRSPASEVVVKPLKPPRFVRTDGGLQIGSTEYVWRAR